MITTTTNLKSWQRAFRFFSIVAILCCTILPNVKAQLPAFPGAEGFGSRASGGRGGMVVEVTNTNDTGVGSFRWAVAQYPTKPITVVFRVSGIIYLRTPVKIGRSNYTIAGQTAPGDGICFKNCAVQMSGGGTAGVQSNLICRYLRFRPGVSLFGAADTIKPKADATGLQSNAAGLNSENMSNAIFDHCSFSWASEENAVFDNSTNVTIQWCISSEGLYNAWHEKGSRSYSGVWGGQSYSIHHNLIAHNNTRTFRYQGARDPDTVFLADSRNNVIYNSHSTASCYGGEVTSTLPIASSHTNIINSTYKPGPATPSNWLFVGASWAANPNNAVGRWHLAGNKMIGNQSFTDSNYRGLDLSSYPVAYRPVGRADTEFAIPAWAQVTTQSADSSYTLVLANAGAILPKRDTVDRRVVNETRTGTATGTGSYPNGIPVSAKFPAYSPSIGHGIIDTPSVVGGWPIYASTTPPSDSDHDGMPDAWELCRGLNPYDSSDRNRISKTGYTELEDYLNGIDCAYGVGVIPVTGDRIRISVYPNPAQNSITVQYPPADKGATITLISIVTGQKIKTYDVGKGSERTTVNTSSLIPGGYAILFLQGNERASETFIKQ